MRFTFIYIPTPTKKEAKKIARYLLEKRLITCANIFNNVESLYWWEGKITDGKEVIVICKTLEKHYEEIVKEVSKVHSYETPGIIKIPMSPNKKYSDWLLSEIKKQPLIY